MKKILKNSIIFIFIAVIISTGLVYNKAQAAPADPLNIQAEAALLVDAQSGRILYQKNPDEQLHPASMTKMMTEYLVLEAIKNKKLSWDDVTSIDDYVYKISQNTTLSNVPLRKDRQYTVRELYESMAIFSANASSIALAELVAGTEADFVKVMNEKAAQLGMKDYNFVNCTGLNNEDLLGLQPAGGPTDENMMSARATATLAFRLIHDFPEALQVSSIATKDFQPNTTDRIKMDNWNYMLPGSLYPILDYPGVDGLKTGHTNLGGYSFTGTAVKNNMRLITVVMKTYNEDSMLSRFYETKKLLDYGFTNYSLKEVFPAGYKIPSKETVPVKDGDQDTVGIELKEPFVAAVKSGEESQFVPEFTLIQGDSVQDGKVLAPIEKGQVLGSLTASFNGTDNLGYISDSCREVVPVVATENDNKAGWLALLFRNIINFFKNLLGL